MGCLTEPLRRVVGEASNPSPARRPSGYDVQPDDSPAKLWVRKPGGAIRRKEMRGVSAAGSLWLVGGPISLLPESEDMAIANGLDSHPSGSGGTLSRPATVKLLRFPPVIAAHRWPKSVVAMSGFSGNGKILPPAGAMGD